MRLSLVLTFALSLAVATSVAVMAQQCPDGTPPPCRRPGTPSLSVRGAEARLLLAERDSALARGDFFVARARACAALALTPENPDSLPVPAGCTIAELPTNWRNADATESAVVSAFVGGPYGVERAEVRGRTGALHRRLLVTVRPDSGRSCVRNRSAVPCTRTFWQAWVEVRLTSTGVVLAVLTDGEALRDSVLSAVRAVATGEGRVLASVSPASVRLVATAPVDEVVSGSFPDVYLADVLIPAFVVGRVRSFTAEGARGMEALSTAVTCRFDRVPWAEALWNLAALYGVRFAEYVPSGQPSGEMLVSQHDVMFVPLRR